MGALCMRKHNNNKKKIMFLRGFLVTPKMAVYVNYSVFNIYIIQYRYYYDVVCSSRSAVILIISNVLLIYNSSFCVRCLVFNSFLHRTDFPCHL